MNKGSHVPSLSFQLSPAHFRPHVCHARHSSMPTPNIGFGPALNFILFFPNQVKCPTFSVQGLKLECVTKFIPSRIPFQGSAPLHFG